MSIEVDKATEEARSIFAATEEALEQDWDQKENLQFPSLLTKVAARLQAPLAAASEIDLFMRSFVRKHPKYCVSRGAKGGIMLRSVYEKRVADKEAVKAAKVQIHATVYAKIAAATVKP